MGANNAGSLEFIDSPQANSGGITTSGIDFTVNYSQEVGPGQLSARLAYTHLIDYATTPVPGALGVGSVTYHDFQAKYSASSTIEVFLGANNVFDEEPPPIISGLPGNVTGSETDAGTYDAIGRRFYGGMRMKF